MIQPTLIAIIVIFIISIVFLIFRKPTPLKKTPEIYVLFNEPYFIKPHELVELINLLNLNNVSEFTHTLELRGESSEPPKIEFENYFSMYSYKCTVNKLNQDGDTTTVESTFNRK